MSAGISSHVDDGTKHAEADATCHDFAACHEDMKPKPRAPKQPCSCHSDDSLYSGLIACPTCKHRSYDPGVGCERRKCGSVEPVAQQLALL